MTETINQLSQTSEMVLNNGDRLWQKTEGLSLIEFCLSLGIALLSRWMLSRLFRDFF